MHVVMNVFSPPNEHNDVHCHDVDRPQVKSVTNTFSLRDENAQDSYVSSLSGYMKSPLVNTIKSHTGQVYADDLQSRQSNGLEHHQKTGITNIPHHGFESKEDVDRDSHVQKGDGGCQTEDSSIYSSFIKGMVEDIVREQTEVIRRDIHDIHIDMMKQLYLNKIETRDFLLRSIPDQIKKLENEVGDLKAENWRLKMKCGEI